MPKTTSHNKKRHGGHHRHSQRYLKTYLPYLPLVVSLAISLILGSWSPSRSHTLAYATEMSISGLFQSTNVQRENNGKADLSLNQKLINAAQTKANDMVARNYWSHNTPDGQEPWVFITNAGYSYQKAGENLAYGFTTSSDTVTGWMNSPEHRANMLDSSFVDVGFGFANGSNYNNSGPETVVVAMYGDPQTLGDTTAAAQPAPPKPTPPAAKPSAQAAPTPTSATPTSPTPQPTDPAPSKAQPTNTNSPVTAASTPTTSVTKAQILAYPPWVTGLIGLLSGVAATLLLIKHGLALRHLMRDSKKFMIKHIHYPLFDSLMIGIIILSLTLTRTVGFIR